jgi:hypothetical protein
MTATLQTTNIQNASSSTTNLALDTSGNVSVGSSLTAANNITATSGTVVMASSFLRNRIINGAMVIDQRNAGASVSVGTATATYTLDRWRVYHDTAITSNITVQQSSTVPSGYINSMIFTNGTAASPSAGDFNVFQQRIEGFNTFDFNYGSASAVNTTLSFWVRSSLTGTFGVGLTNSNQDRSIVYTYTINSANTWEQKSITISGDQSGTWLTNNGVGIVISWDLGSGTSSNASATGTWYGARYVRTSTCTNFIGTTGATFYITGVQLEQGSVATPFERRQYGEELMLCQRYFEMTYDIGTAPGSGSAANTGAFLSALNGTSTTGYIGASTVFKVTKRATPTITFYDTAGTSGKCQRSTPGVGSDNGQSVQADNVGLNGFQVDSPSGTNKQCVYCQYTASAEL